ncbi:MAG: hypothetical protein NTY19_48500 [Planctomycetota bacterium]|nr:hypothetical protein [Planctomycetota bacterium]
MTTLLLLVCALSQTPDEIASMREYVLARQKKGASVAKDDGVPWLQAEDLVAGQAGRLLYPRLVVRQVLGEREMLVRCDKTDLVLSGVNTKDVADGDELSKEITRQHFWVSGIRKLTTVTGATRTLREIKPLDWEKLGIKTKPAAKPKKRGR